MVAGLALGGFALVDPLAPAALPWPGVAEAQAPLAWYDSVTVVVGEDAAWRGFGAALVTGRGILAPPAGRRPRSVWTAVSGSNAIDRNAIFVSRGDERSWIRGGATSARRGGFGDLDLAGDHLWTFGAGARRGAHALEGAFVQRGAAERQRVGYGEAAKGETGWLGWSWHDSLRRASVRLSRGHDERESFGAGAVLEYSRRDAQSNVVELEGSQRSGATELGVRAELRDGGVVRWTGSPDRRLEWRERSVWAAARLARALGPGRLELQAGGGWHDAPGRSQERLQAAPGAAWTLARGGRSVRVFAERIVTPVWSDLAPGLEAFVQDTWTGGAEVRASGTHARASAQLLGGSTGNRATLLRYAVRDVGLELGVDREAERYDFALASAEAGAGWPAFGVDAAGYLLARRGDAVQPRVDPASGATLGATTAFRVFAGDLGVRLRAQGTWVGPRHSDARLPGLFDDVPLDGYATLSAVGTFTLGDAIMVLRGDGLENARRELTWVDPGNPAGFLLARDAGRTFRFELVWPLFN